MYNEFNLMRLKWLKKKENFYSNNYDYFTSNTVKIYELLQLMQNIMSTYRFAPEVMFIDDKSNIIHKKKPKNKKSYFLTFVIDELLIFYMLAKIKFTTTSYETDNILINNANVLSYINIKKFTEEHLDINSKFFSIFSIIFINPKIDLSTFDYPGYIKKLKEFLIKHKELDTSVFFPFQTKVDLFQQKEHVFEINIYKFMKRNTIANIEHLLYNKKFKEILWNINSDNLIFDYAFFNPFSIDDTLYIDILNCIEVNDLNIFINSLLDGLNFIQFYTIALQQYKLLTRIKITKENGKKMTYKEIVENNIKFYEGNKNEQLEYFTYIKIREKIKNKKNFKIQSMKDLNDEKTNEILMSFFSSEEIEKGTVHDIIRDLNIMTERINLEKEFYTEIRKSLYQDFMPFIKISYKKEFKNILFEIIDQIFLNNQDRKDINRLSPYYQKQYEKYKLKNVEDFFDLE